MDVGTECPDAVVPRFYLWRGGGPEGGVCDPEVGSTGREASQVFQGLHLSVVDVFVLGSEFGDGVGDFIADGIAIRSATSKPSWKSLNS